MTLFDSLAHPTLTGRWFHHPVDASFDALARALNTNGYAGACAIGLHGVEGYTHEAFIKECRKHPRLVPIAGLPLENPRNLTRELDRIKELGFRGIKIHPRFCRTWPTGAALGRIFREAARRRLPVFYCTYFLGKTDQLPARDPFFDLTAALRAAPAAKVVLVHGGAHALLRFAELVRASDRLLLDLSFTLMRYQNTSLEADLAFVMSTLPDRVCVGVDFPEYTHAAVKKRVAACVAGLPRAAAKKISSDNLLRFLDLS